MRDLHAKREYDRAYRAKHRKFLNDRATKWREENRDYIKAKAKTPIKMLEARERKKKWRKNNPEKSKAERLRRRLKNPGCEVKATRRWQKKYPHKAALLTQRRKLKKLLAVHPEIDREKEAWFFRFALELTLRSGTNHAVDHIIPLAAGGWHHHDNLQVLPRAVNCSKHDNPFWECEGYKSWRDVPTHLWPDKLVSEYLARLI